MTKARGRLGSNRPVSIALMVCLETRAASASCAWVQSRSARSTRIRFFIPQTVGSR